ncbi:unnamed protein product [Rotaria magnacalcarata]|uniref:Uncharacterized protein n=4 Tax=Bdelloidea TaxID=44578 RepID=A0A815SMC7_9BILA|nr:unnamed protein product [Rotaria magnacalcarata]CAF1492191.1 unnamed protein product [Rotaria magnacalcarata]CAF2101992.1 unnamed protein product [Rotaria magnacalcarata]CAF5075407.1 unnamed protein product [Rotaria magnacalcarata]
MGQTPSTTKLPKNAGPPASKPSELYLACRNGDVEKVKQLVAQLNTADINRLEPNGSTSLHAASFYGHKAIVTMLLQNGAKSWMRNKYEMTPYEEAANDEIRSLFFRPTETDVNRFVDDGTDNICLELMSEKKIEETINSVPNGMINGYKNSGKKFRNEDIQLIVRAQIFKYYLTSLQRSNDCARELQRILKDSVPSSHPDFEKAHSLFDEYCSLDQIESLIRLYTLETNFYGALRSNVEVFAVEMYSKLQTFKDRFFKGQSYRGLTMAMKDIDEYKWAIDNPGTLIEIKTLTSTSVDPKKAYHFARSKKTGNLKPHRVLCECHFDHPCSTAIDLRCDTNRNLPCWSAYEDEAEILVLPGTLFEVCDVQREADTDRYTIILRNIHVPLEIILQAFKEVET